MNLSKFFKVGFTCLGCLIFATLTQAQAIDPNAVTDEDIQSLNDQRIAVTHWTMSPKALAKALSESYELVVDGHFVDIPQPEVDTDSEGGSLAIRPMEVKTQFVIDTVYKGPSAAGNTIEVSVNSDMLDFTGDGRSQYQKRQEVIDKQRAELQDIDTKIASLGAAHDNEEVSDEVLEREMAQLISEKQQILNAGLIFMSNALPLHEENFYSLGGGIAIGEHYLLGFNIKLPSRYELSEFPLDGRNIFWGETRLKMMEDL